MFPWLRVSSRMGHITLSTFHISRASLDQDSLSGSCSTTSSPFIAFRKLGFTTHCLYYSETWPIPLDQTLKVQTGVQVAYIWKLIYSLHYRFSLSAVHWWTYLSLSRLGIIIGSARRGSRKSVALRVDEDRAWGRRKTNEGMWVKTSWTWSFRSTLYNRIFPLR